MSSNCGAFLFCQLETKQIRITRLKTSVCLACDELLVFFREKRKEMVEELGAGSVQKIVFDHLLKAAAAQG